MSNIPAQIWKSSRFTIERVTTGTQGTVLRFCGPFTARDMYSTLSPDAFRDILEPLPGDEQTAVYIIDLTEVPYMDSHGLGILVRHYVRCQSRGIRMSITGVSLRVQELFRVTKMENVLPIAEINKSHCD
jgi:anti-anti-sigma factor